MLAQCAPLALFCRSDQRPRPIHDTHAAVLWDDLNLYVGFWVQEPFVSAFLTERDSLIYTDNNVEGASSPAMHTYYEFEMNTFGTVQNDRREEAYNQGNSSVSLVCKRNSPGIHPFNGVGFTEHPSRATPAWVLPSGISPACKPRCISTAPSTSTMTGIGAGRWNWPSPGQAWRFWPRREWPITAAAPGGCRMDFSRFNQYKEAAPTNDSGGWAWTAHGVWDSHVPECFAYIQFSEEVVR